MYEGFETNTGTVLSLKVPVDTGTRSIPAIPSIALPDVDWLCTSVIGKYAIDFIISDATDGFGEEAFLSKVPLSNLLASVEEGAIGELPNCPYNGILGIAIDDW